MKEQQKTILRQAQGDNFLKFENDYFIPEYLSVRLSLSKPSKSKAIFVKEHQYFVYILECSDGLFYIGVTNDIERRYDEHLHGMDPHCFTFKRRPVILNILKYLLISPRLFPEKNN